MLGTVIFSIGWILRIHFFSWASWEEFTGTDHLESLQEITLPAHRPEQNKYNAFLDDTHKAVYKIFETQSIISPDILSGKPLLRIRRFSLTNDQSIWGLSGFSTKTFQRFLSQQLHERETLISQKVGALTLWNTSTNDNAFFALQDDMLLWSKSRDAFEALQSGTKLRHTPWYIHARTHTQETHHFWGIFLSKKIIQKQKINPELFPLFDGISDIFPGISFGGVFTNTGLHTDIRLWGGENEIFLPSKSSPSTDLQKITPKDILFFGESSPLNTDISTLTRALKKYPQAFLVWTALQQQLKSYTQQEWTEIEPVFDHPISFTITRPDTHTDPNYTLSVLNPEDTVQSQLQDIAQTLQGFWSPALAVKELEDDTSVEFLVAQMPDDIDFETAEYGQYTYTKAPQTLLQKIQLSWGMLDNVFVLSSSEKSIQRSIDAKENKENIYHNTDYQTILDQKNGDISGIINLSQWKHLHDDPLDTPDRQTKANSMWRTLLTRHLRNAIFVKNTHPNYWQIDVFCNYR